MNIVESEICEASQGHPPEGITPKLMREIKSKARSWPNQTEEEKWRDIYQKLFPGEEVPSPCEFIEIFVEKCAKRNRF